MNPNPTPSRPVTEWLSGEHDAEMRVMCAEELGYSGSFVTGNSGMLYAVIAPKASSHKVPDYPASLDACAELRAAVIGGHWVFVKHLLSVMEIDIDASYTAAFDILNATPRQIVLAFVLTRNRVAIS